jgi:hypothetical protein
MALSRALPLLNRLFFAPPLAQSLNRFQPQQLLAVGLAAAVAGAAGSAAASPCCAAAAADEALRPIRCSLRLAEAQAIIDAALVRARAEKLLPIAVRRALRLRGGGGGEWCV